MGKDEADGGIRESDAEPTTVIREHTNNDDRIQVGP